MFHGRPKLAVAASKTLKLGSMPGRPRNSVSYLTSGCAAAVCHNISLLYTLNALCSPPSRSLLLSLPLSLVGLHENDLVKCALISDVLNLRSVHVTPVSAKDWEIIVSIYHLTVHVWVCVCVCQTPVCVHVFACGQIKIVLYRISFWRGRNLSVYLCAVDSFAGIAIDPTGGFSVRDGCF